MRYVLVWADYMSTGLHDEFNGSLDPEVIGLNDNLIRQLSDWVTRYENITPLTELERARRVDEIKNLDDEGLEIARAVRTVLGNDGKVSYFSEGLLKKIPI